MRPLHMVSVFVLAGLTLSGCAAITVVDTAVGVAATVVGTTVDVAAGAVGAVAGSSDEKDAEKLDCADKDKDKDACKAPQAD